MVTFTKCLKGGTNNGNIAIQFEASDGTFHEMAFTVDAFRSLVATGWTAAATIPFVRGTHGQTGMLMVSHLNVALTNMRPSLHFESGPLALDLPLEEPQARELRDAIQRALDLLNPGPKH